MRDEFVGNVNVNVNVKYVKMSQACHKCVERSPFNNFYYSIF